MESKWKNYHIITFLDSLFPKTEISYAVKEMRNRKATGDDDVPGDVLKVMGEVGLKTLKKINQNRI